MPVRQTLRSSLLLLLVVCTVAAAAPTDGITTDSPKRILSIYWRQPDARSLEFERGLRSAFAEAGAVEYYAEYLDTDRFQTEEQAALLRDYFHRKYDERPVHAVIAEAGPVLDFLLAHQQHFFTNSPILYFSARRRQDLPPPGTGNGVSGVVMTGAYRRTFELARGLQPNARTAVVVMRADRLTNDAVREELQGLDAGLQIEFLNSASTAEVVERVAALRAPAFVLYVRHTHDSPGPAVTSLDGLRLVVEAATVPVYAVSESYLGLGIVGGHVYSNFSVGERLGAMALRVANGVRASDVAVEDAPLVPTVDWRAMRRWNLDAGAMPAGTVIQFRAPTVWQAYRWYVAAAAIVVAVQSGLIGTLLVTRARRRKIETTNRAMLRAMPDLVFLLSRDGFYLDYHARDPNELLLKPEQFLGRHMRDVLPPEIAAEFQAAFDRIGDDEPALVEYSLPMDGDERHYEARIVASGESRILAIVRDITDRQRALRSLSEQRVALDASDLRSRRLAGRLIAAQEIERKRIARDLHDDIGQQLTTVMLALSDLKESTSWPVSTAVGVELVRIQHLAEALRRLSHDLHPAVLQHVGLVPAVRAYCIDFERQHGIATEFSASPDFGPVDADTSLCLYRITQEALGNIARHSGAQQARVSLARDREQLLLAITDDGEGFSVTQAASSAGLGLVNIEERVRLRQGVMHIDSHAESGTRLRIALPVEIRPVPHAD